MSITIDRSQPFTSGNQPEADVLALHTTEGMSWPGYNGGGNAPHDTIKAVPGKGIIVRRHIPYNQYGKALRNLPGGGETNRRGVIQVELIGTCDPKHKDNDAWYYWPEADDVVLKALAKYYSPILRTYAIPLVAPAFRAYPASYGNTSVRMSTAEFNKFNGICGHQHVPENDHGDPGAFPIGKFINYVNAARKVKTHPDAHALIKRGSTGTWVRHAQAILKIAEDGIFGPDTEKAVKAFQKSKRLSVDGIVGPKTWAALHKAVGL